MATDKHEYEAGVVYSMSGGSWNHGRIHVNLAAEVSTALKGTSCQAYSSDVKVLAGQSDAYYYPDLSVICGQPEQADKRGHVVANPVAVFEILSPSTEAHDRGRKFARYRLIPSLRAYILISQEERLVEVFTREGEKWTLTDSSSGKAVIECIDTELDLDEIYLNVDFSAE